MISASRFLTMFGLFVAPLMIVGEVSAQCMHCRMTKVFRNGYCTYYRICCSNTNETSLLNADCSLNLQSCASGGGCMDRFIVIEENERKETQSARDVAISDVEKDGYGAKTGSSDAPIDELPKEAWDNVIPPESERGDLNYDVVSVSAMHVAFYDKGTRQTIYAQIFNIALQPKSSEYDPIVFSTGIQVLPGDKLEKYKFVKHEKLKDHSVKIKIPNDVIIVLHNKTTLPLTSPTP